MFENIICDKELSLENKQVFQAIISDYEAARPGYPDELFQDIAEYANLKPAARILEIGAGPGQATAYFARKNYDMTALEISEKQVAYLKEKFSQNASFHSVCSTFEDFAHEGDSFDLVFSATAFHWIDPEVGYPKAFRLLRKNGALAVFWHLASIVEPKTEMLKQIRSIYRTHAPELDDYINDDEAEEMHQLRLSQIQTQNLFQNPVSRVYRWDDTYTTERYLRLMNSYSDFHSVSRNQREAILREVEEYIRSKGGMICIPQEVRLYLARKND
jgi:SAM-dependent methyltransferase